MTFTTEQRNWWLLYTMALMICSKGPDSRLVIVTSWAGHTGQFKQYKVCGVLEMLERGREWTLDDILTTALLLGPANPDALC